MRKNLLSILFLVSVHICNGQILKSLTPSPGFSENLNKVVQDFTYNYRRIQAEQLPSMQDMDVYRSSVTLPGSVQSVIYRFHSKADTSASWQAIMFQGEEYGQAVKAYKNTCRLLNKSRLTLSGNGNIGFSGKINEPEEGLSFSSSSFRLNCGDMAYQKFEAEIELVNTGFSNWEVHLNLHNKKPDTDGY
jgi:hypothetical protein